MKQMSGVVSEIIGLYDRVIEKFGGIDIVVENAGIAKWVFLLLKLPKKTLTVSMP